MIDSTTESAMLSDIHSRVMDGKTFNFNRYAIEGDEEYNAFIEHHTFGMLGARLIDQTDTHGLLWLCGQFYVAGTRPMSYQPIRTHHLRHRMCPTRMFATDLGEYKACRFERDGKYVWIADRKYFKKIAGRMVADWNKLVGDTPAIYEFNPIATPSRVTAWSKCNGTVDLRNAVRSYLQEMK